MKSKTMTVLAAGLPATAEPPVSLLREHDRGRRATTLILLGSALAPAMGLAAPKEVLIAAEDDWYPYGGAVNGESRGLGVDLVRASFAAVGITAKFAPMPYSRCLDQVRQGTAVACNEPARTAETEAALLWPKLPLFKARSLIYGRYPSREAGLTTRDLEGKQVIVTNGFEYGSEFDANLRVKRVVATKEVSVFRMLLARRADYALAYERVAHHLWRQYPEEFKDKFVAVGLIAETSMYCAFSKRHPQAQYFLRLFDEGFAKIEASGERKAIEARWQ